MKAKVTNDGAPYFGSIVDVMMVSDAPVATFRTICGDTIYLASDLDFKYQENEWKNNKPSVDWDAYRREVAKAAMLKMLMCDFDTDAYPDPQEICGMAVLYADELIKQLQGK